MKRAAQTLFLLSLLFGCAAASTASTGCSTASSEATVDDTADSALRQKLATHREQQIKRLHEYAVAGQFPHNMTSPTDLHMFKDADGRLCAVANLIHRDGRDDLVNVAVNTNNQLAIHDVHSGEPMMQWILESGLTQEELERVQLPLPPMARHDLKQPAPSPVDHIALNTKPKPVQPEPPKVDLVPVRPLPLTIVVRDEDAMKTLIRAHIAKVEAELLANTDKSLDLAVHRARTITETRTQQPARVATR